VEKKGSSIRKVMVVGKRQKKNCAWKKSSEKKHSHKEEKREL